MRPLLLPLLLALSGCIVVRPPRHTAPPPPQPVGYSSTAVGPAQPVHGAVPVTGYAPRGASFRMLGAQSVGHGTDRDTFRVGAHEGAFSQLLLKVERSPIELYEMVIDFGDGQRWAPPHRYVFNANTWSHTIDLGGPRVIRAVHFVYRDLPGGGHGRMELWGR